MSWESDTLISDSIARLFSGNVDAASRLNVEAGAFNAALWSRLVEGGFHNLMAPENSSGFGLGWRDAYPVLRAIGYWQAPVPLAETMVAKMLAAKADIEIPDGPLTLIEERHNTRLEVGGSTTVIASGVAHGVPWARHCRAALLSLADGRMARLDLDAPEVEVRPQVNHAGLPSDTLVLSGARLQSIVRDPLSLRQPIWTLGAIARSAMMVGALESALEQSVAYAGDRVQFGRPIGRFQAIQQTLALMAGDVSAARVATLVAAADAPDASHPERNPARASFSIGVAKIRTGEAASRATAIAHQVHGAIGFTHEHSLHFATRRLWAWREEFGSDSWWAAELGRAAIVGGGDRFWPAITDRQFAGA